MPSAFRKPSRVIGKTAVFRNANTADAGFILTLRTDPIKGRYLSTTPNDLAQQEAWLRNYASDNAQVYFIIEDHRAEPYGTIRLYDPQGSSFCWGSWILKDGRPNHFAMESALMVYRFALDSGFTESHFDVRRANESVWKFHERLGAVRRATTDEDYIYKISYEAIESALKKYERFLPNGIEIQW